MQVLIVSRFARRFKKKRKGAHEFVERSLEHGSAIFSLSTGSTETFSPSNQDSVINLFLETRVREGETESEGFFEVDGTIIVGEMVDDEVVEAFSAEIEQSLSVFLFLIFGTVGVEFVDTVSFDSRRRKACKRELEGTYRRYLV